MFLLGFPGSEVAGFQGEQASRNVKVLKRERARWSLQVNGMDFQPSGYSAVASSAGSSPNAAPGVLSHPQAHGHFAEGGLHVLWQLGPGSVPLCHGLHLVSEGSLPWVQFMEMSPARGSVWAHSLHTGG